MTRPTTPTPQDADPSLRHRFPRRVDDYLADQPVVGGRITFDDAASDFDGLGQYVWDPIGVATVAAVDPQSGERVLDACCGTGASAIPAATAVGPSGRVDAVDVSAEMITRLERKCGSVPHVAAHRMDVTAWPESNYDVVQCSLGIFFLPDMTASTRRLVTRARPGARAAYTIWQAGAMEQPADYLFRALDAAGLSPERPRGDHPIGEINRVDSYRSWLQRLGLTEVEVEAHPLTVPASPEAAWLVIIGSGYRGAISGHPAEVVAEIRQRYLELLVADGVIEFDATTLIGTGNRR